MQGKMSPIAFSTMMVDAIREERKTVTRRTTGLEKFNVAPQKWRYDGPDQEEPSVHWLEMLDEKGEPTENYKCVKCPLGDIDDILWVREEHKIWFSEDKRAVYCQFKDGFTSWFDCSLLKMGTVNKLHARKTLGKWQRARFLPKELARIFLQITYCRAERLQEITEQEALKEGVIEYFDDGFEANEFQYPYKNYLTKKGWREEDGVGCLTAVASFQTLWCEINGLKSWEENPWVWVAHFKQCEKPTI